MKLAASMLALSFLACSAPMAVAQDSSVINKSMQTYRLTYTLTEMDAGRKVGLQHYSLTVDNETHSASLKLQSKIPISTGNGQYTYCDVGLTISVGLITYANGIQAQTFIDQEDIVPAANAGASAFQPIIRVINTSNTSILPPGKLVRLASLDIPGSTRHYDVDVMLEQVF